MIAADFFELPNITIEIKIRIKKEKLEASWQIHVLLQDKINLQFEGVESCFSRICVLAMCIMLVHKAKFTNLEEKLF